MTTRELSCLSKLSVRTLLIVTTANSGLIPFIWLCEDAGFGSVSFHRAWIVQHTSCCKNPVNIVRVCSRLCVWPKERVWDGDCPVLIHPCMQSDILLENESERKKTQLNNNCFPFTKLTIVKHSMLLWTLDIMKQVGGEDLTFFFSVIPCRHQYVEHFNRNTFNTVCSHFICDRHKHTHTHVCNLMHCLVTLVRKE